MLPRPRLLKPRPRPSRNGLNLFASQADKTAADQNRSAAVFPDRSGKFQVNDVNPEDFDPDELDTERRDATAMKYSSSKPIRYPDWDDRGRWAL